MSPIKNHQSTIKNLCVFLPNWIGDVVMATPALRALRQHFPEARVMGVMRPYVAGVLEGTSFLDEVYLWDPRGPWNQRGWSLRRRLRQEKFDAAVLFPNSFRSALMAWLAGCRQRVGVSLQGRGWLLTTRLQPPRDDKGRLVPSPAIDSYNRIALALGCPWPGHRMELATTPADEKTAATVWQRSGLGQYAEVVCLNPGAAFGSSKLWDQGSFARLAQLFADLRGGGVLVLCGPAERELARGIARAAARPGVHALADFCREPSVQLDYSRPPLTLGLTKALIRRASLLVTTDSGPRHFAAAFNRPVVTLFGPTHIAWTETYFPAAIHLQKKVDCGPCQLRTCPLDHRCMKLLGPEEVFAASESLLKKNYGAVPGVHDPERKAS